MKSEILNIIFELEKVRSRYVSCKERIREADSIVKDLQGEIQTMRAKCEEYDKEIQELLEKLSKMQKEKEEAN